VFIIFQVTVVQMAAQIVYLYGVIPSSSPTTPAAPKSLLVASLKFHPVLFFNGTVKAYLRLLSLVGSRTLDSTYSLSLQSR
jgi:hypothetical protein